MCQAVTPDERVYTMDLGVQHSVCECFCHIDLLPLRVAHLAINVGCTYRGRLCRSDTNDLQELVLLAVQAVDMARLFVEIKSESKSK